MDELGTFTESPDGAVSLRYERTYPRPIETVWAALTQPGHLSDWLGDCEVEPHVGGCFNVFTDREPGRRVTGKVLEWQPPALLAFTWTWPGKPETVVRWELSRDGESATRLVFTQRGMARSLLALVLPGWHVYLERLGQLAGGTIPPKGHKDREREMQAIYLQAGRLTPAMVDEAEAARPR
ncbi:MAG TPA: SRPBCC domain-containing protein [Stellaceae bacterium]|nr:SRPBCC domain-containing protein [Stellaceae bacterium]